MNKLSFAEKHPFWFTLLMCLTVVVGYFLAGMAAFKLNWENQMLYMVANIILTLTGAGLLTALGWWRRVGYTTGVPRAALALLLVPVLPVAINLAFGLNASSFQQVLMALVLALMVGFVEETFFRGLILRALAPRGEWLAAIVSSVCFGLLHTMNMIAGKPPFEAALQLVYATAIGLGYAAFVLRTGSIWPLVLAHAAIDFVYFISAVQHVNAPGLEFAITLGTTVVFLVYGIWLLLRRRTTAAA